MHDTDLAPIEGRLAAATPGPWEAPEFGFGITHEGKNLFFAYGMGEQTYADMELVAHAPTDLQNLLDELKRTRGQRDKWKYEAMCEHDEVVGLMNQLEAEREHWRGPEKGEDK